MAPIERGNPVEPDRGQRPRHAERAARSSPRRPAANRCRPASCSAPRPGTGCRHSRRFSIICLVACAKRASSRSIGGMSKKPGRKLSSATSISTAAARACERVAKSRIARRLRAGAELSLVVAGGDRHISLPCLSLGRTIEKSAPPGKAPGGAHAWHLQLLLQPHHHAVGRALGVHHGEAHEARPVGLEEQGAAAGSAGERQAVDQHRQRRRRRR